MSCPCCIGPKDFDQDGEDLFEAVQEFLLSKGYGDDIAGSVAEAAQDRLREASGADEDEAPILRYLPPNGPKRIEDLEGWDIRPHPNGILGDDPSVGELVDVYAGLVRRQFGDGVGRLCFDVLEKGISSDLKGKSIGEVDWADAPESAEARKLVDLAVDWFTANR